MPTTYPTALAMAKAETDLGKRAIIEIYASTYHPLTVAPVGQCNGKGVHKWSLQGPVSDMVGARAVNSDYTAGYTDVQPVEVATKIYGGTVKIDRYYTEMSPETIAFQKASRIADLATTITQGIFEGTGTATTMKGLRQFMWDYTEYAGQDAATPGSTSGGDLLTMAALDQALSLVDLGPNCFIYSNEIVRRYMTTLSRSATVGGGSQAITWGPDQFGNQIARYSGIPWIVLQDGASANILSTEETATAATGGSACSVYIVNWGPMTCSLMQDYAPKVYGGMSDGTNFGYDSMDWPVAIAPLRPRSVARVPNVKNAVS